MQVTPAAEAAPKGPANMDAIVTDVEYQGTYVLLGLQMPGKAQTANSTAEFSVMVSEAQFGLRPYQVGEPVQLSWAPTAAHSLSPAAPATRANPSPVPAMA